MCCHFRENVAWSHWATADGIKGKLIEAPQSGLRVRLFLKQSYHGSGDPWQGRIATARQFGEQCWVLRGERRVHNLGKSKLSIGDRATLVVHRCELLRKELSKSVERNNPGKGVDTEKIGRCDPAVSQAGQNVREH